MKALSTPVRLRSYISRNSVDTLSSSGCTIWQAARATSAAVTFFDPIQIGSQQYIDGGTGYNNPVEVVLEEAESIWENATSRIQCLVSIGTGIPEPKDFGDNIKEVMGSLQNIATETKRTAERFSRLHTRLGIQGRYFRFNVDQGLGGVGLDEHKKKSTIADASEEYLCNRRITELVIAFLAARAPRYGT
jgi:predicted acylesterase/phospholipase RssA